MTVHRPFEFTIGPLVVTGFGIAVLFSFLIAQIIAQRELERRGHKADVIPDLVLAAVVGGLLGAKLYYVILTRDLDNLFTRGGFVFWGGLLGGIVAVSAVILIKKIPFWRIADVAGISIAAAYAVGRTGCWAVGDDYGRPWNGFLGVSFPNGAPPSTAAVMQRDFGIPIPAGASPDTVLSVYPTQLFETAMGLGMFFILWRLRDHRHAEGWLFGAYMVLAGIERFLIEFLRAKDDRFFGVLTMAQVIAIAFVVGGIIWMQARKNVQGAMRGVYA